MSTPGALLPTCYRHPDRETRLACSSCGRPVCIDCVRPGRVGQLCADCLAARLGGRALEGRDLGAPARSAAPVSHAILVVCVALFAASLLMPSLGRELFAFGSQFNPLVAAGQWYRLFTSAFLHAGLAHVLFNMWALYLFGPGLERDVGSAPFAALYLSSALAGGVAFYLSGAPAPAVGASGAIFGLFGAWLAAAFRARHTVVGRAGFQQLLVLLGINLALPLVFPGIAWQAHLGGLAAGGIIALAWSLPVLRRPVPRSAAAAAVGVLALAVVV